MNRKLHHTLTALSATAAVFAVLLLAGAPATHPLAPPAAMILASAAAAPAVLAADGTPTPVRHHLRRSRSGLALPYFSFAQGLRRGRS